MSKTKKTFKFMLTLECEIDGDNFSDDDLILDLCADIPQEIPGVLCDRDDYVVLVNSIEIEHQPEKK